MSKAILSELRTLLEKNEQERLSSRATLSSEAIRQRKEERLEKGHRQFFAVDGDRILHSRAYSRYIDKTQVFSLIPNDHLTHRVLHVQLVSKIARTIGRFLRLNEDLIEAIALGHDIGHPPFGHDGERYLSRICKDYGLPGFVHSVQSVRFLHQIENKGKGCNLTLQVLDGILCHDGELHLQSIGPNREKDFDTLFEEMEKKESDPEADLRPMTLEGCVVRMSDVISYIGRDIEDAIRLGLITRDMLPESAVKVLGSTNGTIVYHLVEDLIINSSGKDEICFSAEISDALLEFRDFNMKYIYRNPLIKTEAGKIENLYRIMFDHFVKSVKNGDSESVIFRTFLDGMSPEYRDQPSVVVVRDFIAGMTDAYFLRTGRDLLIPKELPATFKGKS